MAGKRKSSSAGGSAKKAKKDVTNKDSKELYTISEVEQYGTEIMEAKQYNHFVGLISQFETVVNNLKENDDHQVEILGRKIAVTLYKNFQKLFKEGLLSPKKSHDEKKALIVKWLIDKYGTWKSKVFEAIGAELAYKTSLQLDLLEIVLGLVRLESQYFGPSKTEGYFANMTYSRLIKTILSGSNGTNLDDGTNDDFILLEFIEKFGQHWDLQAYSVNSLHEQLGEWRESKSKEQLRSIFSKFFTLMKNKLLFSEDSDELAAQPKWVPTKLPSSAFKPVHFKTQFQKCFVVILSYPLSPEQYKATLLVLHKRVIPYMVQPQNLMDFLTDCYDVSDDSIIPVLALNSLYELMRKFNLEYPDFYTKLYSILTPELLCSRYRSRFFRLCDLFLSSTHLSASLVASFIKKLARLAITAPASGVVIVIPFVYNLFKRHPSCMIMLHNTESTKFVDKFDNSQTNPLLTKAIDSSLWELETLMTHYHPNIATLAKVFGEPFRKHSYNMEDFLDWSYVSLLDSEKNRRYKGMAALEFEQYDGLFGPENAYSSGWEL